MPEDIRPSTIPALLSDLVSKRGGHEAIVTPDETLTYHALDEQSARLALSFLAIGAGKGTRIALLAPDGPFFITAFLAALRIGALITVISTLCSPKELAYILKSSDAQIFVSVRCFLHHDYADKLETAFPAIKAGQHGRLRLADAPFLRSVWFDDPSGHGWAGSHDDLFAALDREGSLDRSLLLAIEREVYPSDDAVIIYTSGSTSQPKAVIHTQWNITRHPPELARLFLIKPEDRMLHMLPLFWLGGMAMMLEVLSQGATLVYPVSPKHEDLITAITGFGVNRLNGWGDGLTRLRALAGERGIDVDTIVGLGPFRDAAGNLIPVEFQSGMLGMSETFACHSAEPLNYRMPDDKPNCCGRPVNGYERRIVDPDTGREVPTGTTGELQLRGGALMRGFYKKRDAEVFTADGYYPTGDLCRIDDDDYLYFIARRNDMIKTRAANVSRLEVEAALNALPGIKMSAVTGLPDPEFGQIVAAAIVPDDGQGVTSDSIYTALRDALSSYKIPRQIAFVTEADILRTATGKLKLHELGRLIQERACEEIRR